MRDLMDRALKERIIGAVVLVAIAVLVVPIFLDGPSGDSFIVSESVTLPGQNDQEMKQQTIVLERDRTEPVPVAVRQEEEPKPVSAPVATKTAPAPKPTPQAVKAESPPAAAVETESATGMWAVQLGSFSSQENAERLAADLRKQGYAAFLSQLKKDSNALHRVRVGPQKDRESAQSVAARLGSAGHSGQVVPHP